MTQSGPPPNGRVATTFDVNVSPAFPRKVFAVGLLFSLKWSLAKTNSSARGVMSVWDLRRWRWVVVLTSATMFIVSLTQTAFVVDVSYNLKHVEPHGHSGLDLLIVGWAGVFDGRNLLIFPSIIAAWVFACRKRLVAAAIAALPAISLISISLSLTSAPPDSDGTSGYAAWLANPVIAVTWGLYLRNARPSAPISAVLELALTLSFLLVKTVPWDPKEGDFSPIISYGIGYWLWVASAAILAAGVSADVMFQRVINAPAKPPV
jgi:hypothetical protein